MPSFGDYIVYVDESGDHGLANINPDYPLFVLSFCVFHKNEYINNIIPNFLNLKFKYFGHEMVIFHEREIRKQIDEFICLRNSEIRNNFLTEITTFVERCNFTLIAVVIKKELLRQRYSNPYNPYELAMKYGLERLYGYLRSIGATNKQTIVIFEKRGNVEDNSLELEFRRVCDGENALNIRLPFDIKMASKQWNSCGLQLADLTARPIGQHCLNPSNGSRAYAALERKFYSVNGQSEGNGLKIFP